MGIEHLLEEFVSLQEIFVLLVSDEDFNRVFQDTRLTDLRVLLSSIAGRIEAVTGSPGLQMTLREAQDLRNRITSGQPAYHDIDPTPPHNPDLAAIRRRLAEVRESAEQYAHPPNGTDNGNGHGAGGTLREP